MLDSFVRSRRKCYTIGSRMNGSTMQTRFGRNKIENRNFESERGLAGGRG